MAAERAVRVRAFAKLNLSLRIVGVRADGYHDLRTTFQSLALHDTLRVSAARGPFTIECDDPGCPRDPSNLVWRAAELLWRERGRRGEISGVRVRIAKRIPSQAGLGGGSSDGAAALRALTALWRMRLDARRMASLAAALGADVPYFLEGGSALGLDRGDTLFALLDESPTAVVVARPGFGVRTEDAYSWWDADQAKARPGAPGRSVDDDAVNDLEPPVVARHPEVGELIGRLQKSGAVRAAMSGSGSAVFGLFRTEQGARRAAATLARQSAGTLVTKFLSRGDYRRLAAPRSA